MTLAVLSRRPPRPPTVPTFLITAAKSLYRAGWPAFFQLSTGLLLALPYLVLLAVFAVSLVLSTVVGIGLILAVPLLWLIAQLGRLELSRVNALAKANLPAPQPVTGGWWARYPWNANAWKAAVHLLMISAWSLAAGAATLMVAGASLAAIVVAPTVLILDPTSTIAWGTWHMSWWQLTLVLTSSIVGLGVVTPLMSATLVFVDRWLARTLISGFHAREVAQLTSRVSTLTQARAHTLDSVTLERQRIERDLHDGPQQRLTAIAMDLGIALRKIEHNPTAAKELVLRAHSSSKEAIAELRQVIRGIHPPILTERGLDAALTALAGRSPIPTVVHTSGERLPVAVETVVYFCVSEAINNATKHSGAQRITITITTESDVCTVTVNDDGVGGAKRRTHDPTAPATDSGTGLSGLDHRLAAVDGTLHISSPHGGPTVLTMLIPIHHPTESR